MGFFFFLFVSTFMFSFFSTYMFVYMVYESWIVSFLVFFQYFILYGKSFMGFFFFFLVEKSFFFFFLLFFNGGSTLLILQGSRAMESMFVANVDGPFQIHTQVPNSDVHTRGFVELLKVTSWLTLRGTPI